ncbi:rho GTPase-activating protein 5-like isoform X1 [Aristolochia californica]|uniref:rho GTPase-activating protein 5-like isoform X1 n=2 Tax=Aristolochia californica TaxID=171875 RepID=UPI0035D93E0E
MCRPMARISCSKTGKVSRLKAPARQEEEEEVGEGLDELFGNPISSPFIGSGGGDAEGIGSGEGRDGERAHHQQQQFPVMEILLAALRKSLLTCAVDREDMCSMDIGWPTDVRHVSHVTFDRFNGFLGLPVEFEPEVPRRVPSASANVFGVSAESMQCSYDQRGNSVPTILLLMQRHLYLQGGLQAEGIFRINAENSQEQHVRDQLNKGIVPHGIDKHCLAGLIKAWFRELPTGVLDSLTPEQVMHCNTEEECSELVKTLPPTEAALLDWAINLMADVVQYENLNKMNARNIAMVFAPNMTQMADPLTALIHAVQVMNFLKTLIIKTLREREEAAAEMGGISSCSQSPSEKDRLSSPLKETGQSGSIILGKILSSSERSESEAGDSFRSFELKSECEEELELICGSGSPAKRETRHVDGAVCGNGDVEGFLDRLRFRKSMKKLCNHPVFQLSRPLSKKSGGNLGLVNSEAGAEAWT